MKSKGNKYLRFIPSNMLMQQILYFAILLLCVTNVHAGKTWTEITVDSIKVNGNTLLGKQYIDPSNDHYFFRYHVVEINAKCDSIKKSKLMFGINETSPLWKNYWLTAKESKKHINFINSFFQNSTKNSTQQQISHTVRVLVDEDGSCYCSEIITRVKLTDFFPASDLIDLICQIGTFKYTTPLVKNSEHGWYEFNY